MMELTRTCEVIATEINAIKEQARAMLVSSAIEIGKRLAEAKELVPFGSWGKWLEENVSYSERTAQNLMRCWEEYGKKGNPQTLADLSLSKAVTLLGATPEQRRELLESGDAETLSVRELQKKIDEMQQEMESRQMRIDELLAAQEDAEATRRAAMETVSQAMDAQAAAQTAIDAKKEAEEKAATLEKQYRDALRELDAERKKGRPSEAQEREMQEMKAALSKQKTAAEEAREALRKEHERAEEAIRRAVAAENRPPEQVTVTVKETPPEVTEELERLREVAKKAPSEDVIRLREYYARALKEFESLKNLLDSMGEAGNAYRKAMCEGLRKMAGRLDT